MKTNPMFASLMFKIVVSFILAAIMLICLFIVADDFHLYLGQFIDGKILQLICFSIIFLASLIGLVFIMASQVDKRRPTKFTDSTIGELVSRELKIFAINFVDGFVSEITKDRDRNRNR